MNHGSVSTAPKSRAVTCLGYEAPHRSFTMIMNGPLLERRRQRRALLALLSSRGFTDRRFLWRRLHLVLPGGRPVELVSHQELGNIGINTRSFFDAFDAATADRRGVPVHVVLAVYAVSTYLPDVPFEWHKFDFELEPVRDATSLSSTEARHILEEEKTLLLESPWRDPSARWYLDRDVVEVELAPKLVAVRRERYSSAGPVDRLWKVAEFSDYVLLLDGNRRFGLALRGYDEPLTGLGFFFDLAHAFTMAEWV